MSWISLEQLVSAVQSQQALISFPTDTVPALAAAPTAAEQIYTFKQRPPDKPLILMGASFADLSLYIAGSETERLAWQAVTAQHWPGPLTLVLPASDRLPPVMNPTQDETIGIRVPNQPLAQALLSQTGPLATTSVNLSGQPPLQSLAEVAQRFPQLLMLSEDAIQALQARSNVDLRTAAAKASGIPSTVAKWTDGQWLILRQGAVRL
ncbi:L-threonylcarbamoyladenylate synthase [Romeria aff. gracilis LEGE 07310]|uniref:L-threonylcarbamoyladenylate synthase n=1 Tax=Vasconcelosia minhoensis LEGE 07310 TaxID=915328 RepID=A0A8J7ATQ3_9CYAN|nr:L-threonylcarbamoyladenylate synthase [Romeria gracilis]MBE9076398.1 L-threonylcarbamoyladenylate synthase [Romeria aff. gracilis LEGE 07310]